MGMEMLIKALLNALGFSREDFDKKVGEAKQIFDEAQVKLADYDARLTRMEKTIFDMSAMQSRILAMLENNAASAASTEKE